MPLLVDGHNLIGYIPTISLSDPDDEGKLVMLLRGYATAKRGRQVFVVFDKGVYGHPGTLNGYGVNCSFARSPQDADAQIIRRLRALTRPGDWALVTSDRRIIAVAHECKVQVIGAHTFAQRLVKPAETPMTDEEKPAEIQLSPGEIREWLILFGEPVDDDADADWENRMPFEHNPPKKKKRRR